MSSLSRFLLTNFIIGSIYCFTLVCIVWFGFFEIFGAFTPILMGLFFLLPMFGIFLLFLIAGIVNYISYLIASSFSKDNSTLFTVMFSATFSLLLLILTLQIIPSEFIYKLVIGIPLGINVLVALITAIKLKMIKDEQEAIDIW